MKNLKMFTSIGIIIEENNISGSINICKIFHSRLTKYFISD